jgi:hypothetical protein
VDMVGVSPVRIYVQPQNPQNYQNPQAEDEDGPLDLDLCISPPQLRIGCFNAQMTEPRLIPNILVICIWECPLLARSLTLIARSLTLTRNNT